jgi:tRNA(Arg) A34 adenosine deaminase TadA
MCAGAIAAYRIKKLVFGAYDVKSGAVEHGPRIFSHATTHHRPEIIGGVRDSDCSALLETFFSGLRNASS